MAQPQPAVKKLMDQPASEFSLGLLRMELWLKDAAGPTALSSVDYSSGENKITLRSILQTPPSSLTERRTACQTMLTQIRRRAGINPDTGMPDAVVGHSILARFFRPATEVSDLAAQIETMTRIHISMAGLPAVECAGPVASTRIQFSEPATVVPPTQH